MVIYEKVFVTKFLAIIKFIGYFILSPPAMHWGSMNQFLLAGNRRMKMVA